MSRDFFKGLLVGATAVTLVVLASGVGFFARTRTSSVSHVGSVKLPSLVLPSDLQVDYEWKLRDMKGQQLSLSSFRDKVVLLTFWDPECQHCIEELPSLSASFAKVRDSDIAYVCVALSGSPESLSLLAQNQGISLPLFFSVGPPPKCFSTSTIPVTYLLTRQGRVEWRNDGAANWDDDRFVAYLTGLATRRDFTTFSRAQ